MTLFSDVGIDTLITLGLSAVGGIGGYFTLRAKVRELAERVLKTEARADASERAFGAFQLEVSKTYAGKDALREIKDDLSREIRDIEHVVRGALTSALAGITPNRRRPGGE